MNGQSHKSSPMNSPNTHSATSLPGSADGLMPSSLQASPAPSQSGRVRAHASRSQRQVNKKVSLMSATSGQPSSISSASASLSMCLGSRLQMLLGTAGSMEYRQTWKEKTTPAGRQYWAHTASAHPISGSGCTGWPTPTTGDSASSRNSTANRKTVPPTGIHKGDTLTDAVTFVHGVPQSTSSAEMEKSGAPQLNPAFSLWLMGFPAEWASCGAVAMQLSRKQQPRSSRPALKPSMTRCSESGEDPLADIW